VYVFARRVALFHVVVVVVVGVVEEEEKKKKIKQKEGSKTNRQVRKGYGQCD
jgi:hypothetical protein